MPLASCPKWEDHFLGLVLDPRYRIVLGATTQDATKNPVVKLCQGSSQSDPNSIGGRVTLQTGTAIQANCYLRFGEASGSSSWSAPQDARNWTVKRNAVGESRVVYGTNTYLQTSVGFVGYNDPQNFCEFYYDSRDTATTWRIAACLNGQHSFIDTGFTHQPGEWLILRVQTNYCDGAPTVEAYINDFLVATITDSSKIPLDGMAWEWNIYNFPVNGRFSNSAMWIDWLYLSQDL